MSVKKARKSSEDAEAVGAVNIYRWPTPVDKLACRLEGHKGSQYPKDYLTWHQIKVGKKGSQSLEENSSIPFTFPSRRHWHCPQNCKKEISGSPKKLNKAESRSKGMRTMGPLGPDFSRRQYQTPGACSLRKNGHCGTNLQCKLDMRRPRMAS